MKDADRMDAFRMVGLIEVNVFLYSEDFLLVIVLRLNG